MSNSVKAHLSCFLHSSCMKARISSGYSYQEKASSSTWCMHKEDPALWKQESRSQGWAQSQFYIFFTKILTSPFSDRSINHTFSRENSPILGKKKKSLKFVCLFFIILIKSCYWDVDHLWIHIFCKCSEHRDYSEVWLSHVHHKNIKLIP